MLGRPMQEYEVVGSGVKEIHADRRAVVGLW
jgi:hypothetical protein